MSDLPDKGYMRGYPMEWVNIETLSERPEDAPGDQNLPLLRCERVAAEELAQAFDSEQLMEQLEQFAFDNGLCGEGPLSDYFDFVDGFAEKLEAACRKAVVDGLVKSRYFHVEKVSEPPK